MVQTALLQIFQCQLRNKNSAFSLRLVDVPNADQIYIKCPKHNSLHTAKFVSGIKNGRAGKYTILTFAKIPARRRLVDTTETPSQSLSAPELVSGLEIDNYDFYVQTISHPFDPKRVLLRCLYFINENRTKYVSVGFYHTRDYQPFVEFCVVRSKGSRFIIHNDNQIDSMNEYLTRMCDFMLNNEQAGCKSGDIRKRRPEAKGSPDCIQVRGT